MSHLMVYGIGKEKALEICKNALGATMTVSAGSDYEAAMEIKAGRVDYAIGICQSGAGGALSLVRALVGSNDCAQLSSPSRPPTDEEITAAVTGGKRVFGLAVGHIDQVVPKLVSQLIQVR